ncbi:MAG: hypothetical protein KC615_09070 [Anaerolineae bacterium]|nr:hypothetical protein [Anaerolineae bacterium]MCA9893123.1 hypothetical protein [Anaerolineae bacterium]
MQDPNVLLAILSQMGRKSEVQFDKLFQKLYNTHLWVMAYEQMAPKAGNMTPGVDGHTIDGMSKARIEKIVAALKASRYVPKPVRRMYIPKANGKQRPLGIPSFEDKLLQTVVKLLLEAIYEPTFSNSSHGFRPQRSCHTALEEIKKMNGVRWWIEGDIQGFFDNLNHGVLLNILGKRIKDKRFLHLIDQFLKAGYIENWQYHRTYSGTPQGGPLSPLLANIYLNELDQAVEQKVIAFNQGKRRRANPAYRKIIYQKGCAKHKARETGDWTRYKALQQQLLQMQPEDQQDPNFRRLRYVRYADDFLIGIVGSKADAKAIKTWIAGFLKQELQLELSAEKTLITNARDTIRFLGYDIQRWAGKRVLKVHTPSGVMTKRTTSYHLALRLPYDKLIQVATKYGDPQTWRGHHRGELHNLSELEIMLIYNTELRGFFNYYALADNLKYLAAKLLWMSTASFMRTLAGKRNTTMMRVIRSLKKGTNQFVITLNKPNGKIHNYRLVSSTKQLEHKRIAFTTLDQIPNTIIYRKRTELGRRFCAQKCEWCGTRDAPFEVHHVRGLKDLKGKTVWERQMIERQRKTMILCHQCHKELHAGKLRPRPTY